jgi:hypothetical protein
MESLLEYTNTSSNITYQDGYSKVVNTFPIYYKIFNKYYSEGKDVSWELNRIYQRIFTLLIEYYDKFMTNGINDIISDIKNKFNPDKPYAIIDYLEYLFGNILYETFLFEIKKINPNDIRYEYLCVFEYIIRVECVKYQQYYQIIEQLRQTEPESKLLLAMENRIEGCLKKISFCLSWLRKNYVSQILIIELCVQIIEDNGLESKIDSNSVNTINSFMELSKKKTYK